MAEINEAETDALVERLRNRSLAIHALSWARHRLIIDAAAEHGIRAAALAADLAVSSAHAIARSPLPLPVQGWQDIDSIGTTDLLAAVETCEPGYQLGLLAAIADALAAHLDWRDELIRGARMAGVSVRRTASAARLSVGGVFGIAHRVLDTDA